MKSSLKTTLFVALPLISVLWFPLGVMARDSTRLTERDLRSFDEFLDTHWETAQELYRDPELLNNERFLQGHRDLRNWLDDHQDAADALQANPRAAIWRERTAGRREPEERGAAATRLSERDLRSFEDYLNAHDETARLLYENPDLIKDRQFVRNHDSLNDWLREHPDAAEAITANPHKVLWRERSSNPQDFLRQLLK